MFISFMFADYENNQVMAASRMINSTHDMMTNRKFNMIGLTSTIFLKSTLYLPYLVSHPEAVASRFQKFTSGRLVSVVCD